MTRRIAATLVAVVVTALTSCSSDTAPAESVPELSSQLDKVDAAIAAGDYAKARAAIDALVARTAKAQVAGEISDDEAGRVFDAAREVLAELPSASPTPSAPSTPPTPPATEDSPTIEPPGDDGPGPGEKKHEGKGEKKHEKD